jgi:hypothetical protein
MNRVHVETNRQRWRRRQERRRQRIMQAAAPQAPCALCGQPCDPEQTTFRLAVPLGHDGNHVACNDCIADAVVAIPLTEATPGCPDRAAPEPVRPPPLRSGQLVTWTDRGWQRPA